MIFSFVNLDSTVTVGLKHRFSFLIVLEAVQRLTDATRFSPAGCGSTPLKTGDQTTARGTDALSRMLNSASKIVPILLITRILIFLTFSYT
jgi:hypothetical protein